MIKTIKKLLGRLVVEDAPIVPTPAQKMKISMEALAKFANSAPEPVKFEIKPPVLPKGVIPAADKLAMDAAVQSVYDYASEQFHGLGFPGYPYLAELTQRSEFRSPSETTATEMTRRWIKVVSHGDGDKADKIEKIEAELKRHKVRDLFKTAAEQDGFFGRAQIYIDVAGDIQNKDELPLIIDKATIKKGALNGFKNIEALWTAPYNYDSTNPMAKDFFKPTSWFVMGQKMHASRLLTFISRPVPDMLKPAYNFGGMSMTQLMEPYVDAWLRTRDSVSDLLHSFSISGLSTDMSTTLSGGSGSDLFSRAQLFNQMRDNRGLMVLDKETEEFFQFNTPLSGLDKLQAQSQEQMAAPCHTPLVKLLGITPTGLNASTDGEIAVYYDFISAMQSSLFTTPLETIIKIIQLDQFGEIDPAISFEFEQLEQMNDTELAAVRKSDADAGVAYITAGVLSPEEERTRLAADPQSGYSSLDVSDVPQVDVDTQPDDGFAADAESIHWITLENGEHVQVDEHGEVIAGAGGNMNGTKFDVKSKSAPIKVSAQELTPEQRNKIAKSETLYQKYGSKGEGSRAEFKEKSRGGKLDHLYTEYEAEQSSLAEAQKKIKKEKSEAWKEKHLPRLVKAKTERIQREQQEKVAKISAYKSAQSTPVEKRQYLNVPFSEKEHASASGAVWDPDRKKWFYGEGELPSGLIEYKQKQPTSESPHATTKEPERKIYTHRKMPTSGYIDADDPSIYGSELLGHEGESWESFNNSFNSIKRDYIDGFIKSNETDSTNK